MCRYDPEGEYNTDTDNGDNHDARTLLGASHCTWYCQVTHQGEVCRYDPEGEYDTDTDRHLAL